MPQQEADKLMKPYPVRFLPEHLDEIREKAALAGLPVGTFIRKAALEQKVPGKSRLLAINELRRQGGLLKHLFTEAGGYEGTPVAPEFRMLLLEITGTIRQLARGDE